ncbi:DNA/RNA polymerase superfamily protein [Gossypium australe]|uniref:DNA/RNA polymerase superfamily protein n=1 Tax=Gossypium australe TaxID=47621 RepID=A0A5B6VP56_9ROSI|nr:DNA/RNA polymerase superfamily protein [Gossypium australe]
MSLPSNNSYQSIPRWHHTRPCMVESVELYCTTTSDHQKSYVDLKRKDIELHTGDNVFLKVSPWKKVLCFSKKGKLSPRFIGSYEILERVSLVAYRLALPSKLDKIHNIFHVSMLQWYKSDPSHVISPDEVELQPDFSYSEELIKILAQEVKGLRNK